MILSNDKEAHYSSLYLKGIFAVLIIFFTVNISSGEKKGVFPWGKTAKEIFRVDDEQLNTLWNQNEIPSNEDVYGVSSHLLYFFSNEKSIAIECKLSYYKDGFSYQGIYDIIHKALSSKYGNPRKELRIWLGGREKKTYRDLEEAVQEGSIVQSSFWIIPETAIYYEIYSGETIPHNNPFNYLYFTSLPYFNTLNFPAKKSNFIIPQLSWDADPLELQKNMLEKYYKFTDYNYGTLVNSVATIEPYINTYGYNTKISIIFSQNKLQSVIFHLTDEGKNTDQTLIDYYKIESILEDYYGKPYYKKEIWPKNTTVYDSGYTYKHFKGDIININRALAKGEVEYRSRRKTANNIIIHYIKKNEANAYGLNHKVIFQNNSCDVDVEREEKTLNLDKREKVSPAFMKYSRGLDFQMRVNDVKKKEGPKLISLEDNDSKFLIPNIRFMDRNVLIWLHIWDNLKKLTYEFIEEETDNRERINSYYKLNKKMIEDLGEPTQEKLIWEDIIYRSDPNSYIKALEQGHLRFETNWVSESMVIRHLLIPVSNDPEDHLYNKKSGNQGKTIYIKHLIRIQGHLDDKDED